MYVVRYASAVASRDWGMLGFPRDRPTDVTNASVDQANGTFQIEHHPLCAVLERFPVVQLARSDNEPGFITLEQSLLSGPNVPKRAN